MTARQGFTLLECMVAATLGTLVLAVLAATLVTHERLARAEAEHLARSDAMRTPAVLLHAELRSLAPEADLRALAPDSLSLRAFRGAAVVCGSADDTIIVAYRGIREPEAAKDSILLIGLLAPAVRALQSVEPIREFPDCSPAAPSRILRLRLQAAAPPSALALVFESGSYFLSGNALRYRRGAEGRQPLTTDRIDNASRFDGLFQPGDSALRGIRFDLRTRAAFAPATFSRLSITSATSFLNAVPDSVRP